MKLDKTLLLILLVDSLIWLRSGWGKFSGGKFVEDLPKTLDRFSSQNPHLWYKGILGVIRENHNVWGNLIMYGELVSSLVILVGVIFGWFRIYSKPLLVLMAAALLGLSFMNLNFYLASGWTSPSSDGLNLLMFAVQIFVAFKFLSLLKK
ncbi:hypothetical protein A3H85_02560 [Candidatus Daviesbacteria bacterium RIFCSPLOWO2_02_FULL_40_8]|uniref:DoxX family protein n=1 Tax=Candidatus Daviesbacteria bacterium RIFCSPLOWO2_01_FULL_40_24 TaxID=1797787 RepID=A0A1F5MIF3_9BACT|nr:MAG: hypothetical protein A2780_03290 [Candidatus Daviesbacteria bacterium RIFCSPHIGHO2_01_FULL_41_45]OGE34172.1 MAG: hypothetical protein A3C32_00375 [Candidatus Daviesbacteria bacterium RIFCSPHIGHO2_02_FULL_41_14]OGE65156.1 MAG: hypothetical protein A3B49_01325 [Candidatus Daviesbacteria bacterium RIFCSPLOWO2_01_FULL_40_24]OGE66859.1 MAG: hypothetical protein A3H85_02560 [Candidatus Daviesbacteria bacterium RIFCSPLOWO2_02_FULL_40_8]